MLEQLVAEGVDVGASSSLFVGIYRGRARRNAADQGSPIEGLPPNALPVLQRAARLWGELAARHPQVSGFRNDLAGLHNILGLVQSANDMPGEALDSYEKARLLWEQLVREQPQNRNFKIELATTYGNSAAAEQHRGRPDAALAAQLEALRRVRELADADPLVFAFQNDLAGGYCQVGTRKSTAGKSDEEIGDAFQRSLDVYEGLITVSSYHREVAAVHAEMGKWHHQRGRPAEALRQHQKSRELRQRLLDRDPGSPVGWADVADSWYQQALVLEGLERREEALAACWEAVEHQGRALAGAPQAARARHALHGYYRTLARLQHALGRPAEAVAACLECRRLIPLGPAELYETAAELALCIPLLEPKRSESRTRPVDEALAMLREAHAAGLFADPAQRDRLRTDDRLAPLRETESFRKLLAELGTD